MSMKTIVAIVLMIIAYLIGNISPATLLARAAGKDIKKEGSGNAGTTNVLRVLGAKAAIITLVIDVLKGVLATLLGFFAAYVIAKKMFDPIFTPADNYAEAVSAWCGLSVFIGHIWPILFKFKGGKGVATALGVLLATEWKLALICLGVFAIIVVASRIVSLGSMVAAVTFLIIFVSSQVAETSLYRIIPTIVPFVIMVGLLIFKHKENMGRIMRGEENKLSFKKNVNNIK
ncbi:MAG: glycerol-3-phosphate 1-O-acyltransferase PlsY [Firmicutes bacterium]|nr:glycerol-3-phosphate 1-O-acyltransferase PlsY [Bacillota bacterium]